ncbi:hypothetical protein ACFPVY_04090 [Flavobacterium qiangtangense]|uniref:Uncharacterized protein n=1 Tax=Flavobacterium qiangtangense TaxID=1442595 RepID=A0ABW1PLI2_9FLAO
MANTKKFDSDSEWGKYWEWESISFIQECFNKVLNPSEKRIRFLQMNESTKVSEMKKWDSKFEIIDTLTASRKKILTFEIKSDKYESSNLFFEKTCSKSPSGVYATEADYFIYILPRYQTRNFFIIEPKKLMQLLDEKYQHSLQYGGDGQRVFGYVINKDSFELDFIEAGGKIKDWTVEIPLRFEVKKFADKSRTVYQSDVKKNYPDPLNFF